MRMVRMVRMVAVRSVAVREKLSVEAGCAHAVRGAGCAFGIGVGGRSGGGLHEQNLSHRAAQLKEERR
jgi:hypothetical protein